MKSIIADLWNGNIAPIENCGKNNAEIEELMRLAERHRKALGEILNDKQKESFEKYVDCIEEYLVLIARQAFCDGFSIGSKIISEALTDDK